MANLEKVRLENFKSHEDTTVEFDKDLTVIVGATNSGKSAILDGIKWALYNEPTGSRFIQHGKPYAKVTLYFDNGKELRRTRGHYEGRKDVNKYELVWPNGEIITYASFGSVVPDEVVEFHGMKKVKLFNDEQSLNMADQLEPPFFLGETPQAQARMIGNMANVDVIDHARTIVEKELRAARAEEKTLLSQNDDYNDQLERLSNTPELEEIVEDLSNRYTAIDKENLRLGEINRSIKKINTLKTELKAIDNILLAENKVDDIVCTIPRLIEVSEELLNISRLARKISLSNDELLKHNKVIDTIGEAKMESTDNIDEMIKNANNLLAAEKISQDILSKMSELKRISKKLEFGDVSNILESVNDIDNKIIPGLNELEAKIEDAKKRRREIEKLEGSLKSLDAVLSQSEELESLNNRYKELLKDNEVCPICNSVMTDEKVESINI